MEETPVTQGQIKILMENNENSRKEIKGIRRDIGDLSVQIDNDRKDLNKVREDFSTMVMQFKNLGDSIDTLITEMKEVKKLKESLPDTVKSAVTLELQTISLNNPRKRLERNSSVFKIWFNNIINKLKK